MLITTAEKPFLFFTLICTLTLVGLNCSKRPDISGVKPEIVSKGTLKWRINYDGLTWVDVKGYIFHMSQKNQEIFEENKKIVKETIDSAREGQYTAPTEELRKFHKEMLESYTKGDMRYLADWPNWPIVMVLPVLLEGAKPTKAVAVCRCEIKSFDIIFTMYCPDEISLGNFLDLTQLLTINLENLSDEEWKSLPKEEELIFDSEGEVASKHILEFTKDAVFIPQR